MDKAFDLVMSVLRPQFDAMPITEDDYLHADGLIHCAKCDTPKQMLIDLLGTGEQIKVKVLCRCQETALDLEEAQTKARKRRESLQRSRETNIDNIAWHSCTFDSDDQRDPGASTKARNYVKNFEAMLQTDTGLLMYGGLGSGKTYLAASIANALLEEGRNIMMTNITSLVAKINANFGEERDYWLSKIARAHLLILDDFGVERTTEYAMEQAYEVVNARYKSGKPMIITTNLTMQEMQKETLLEKKRVFDRVTEKCIPLRVQGESRRRDIANKKMRDAMEMLEGKLGDV